jgi:hypothetical protein
MPRTAYAPQGSPLRFVPVQRLLWNPVSVSVIDPVPITFLVLLTVAAVAVSLTVLLRFAHQFLCRVHALRH